jgi:hypothetical protein
VDPYHSSTDTATLRPEIAASWRRSTLAGLDHATTIETTISDVDASSRIMQAAAPVLKELSQQFVGFEVGALLADRSATLVAGCFGTASLQRETERLGALPGVTFSEDRSGTNAIATPFETRVGLFVRQDEHFLSSMRQYFCYGIPILHPLTQRVEAVIDVMTPASTNPALMKLVMDRAARDIRQQLIETYDVNVMALFAAFNALRRNSADAVVMISEDIVLNNRHSVDILAPEDYVTLRAIALERPGFSGTIDLSLSSGECASVRITDMGDPPAMVFQLKRFGLTKPVVPRGALAAIPRSELDRGWRRGRACRRMRARQNRGSRVAGFTRYCPCRQPRLSGCRQRRSVIQADLVLPGPHPPLSRPAAGGPGFYLGHGFGRGPAVSGESVHIDCAHPTAARSRARTEHPDQRHRA